MAGASASRFVGSYGIDVSSPRAPWVFATLLSACASNVGTETAEETEAQSCAWPSTFSPDTDWLSETSLNTSNNGFPSNADPAFKLNGDAPARRVSAQDIDTLLYPGATTKIYGHLMAWFDHSGTLSAKIGRPAHNGHKDAGYDSYDPAQIDAQIEDMVSRGMSGMMVNWKGPDRPPYLSSYRSFTDITLHTIRDRIANYNATHGAHFELVLQPEAAQGSSFATSGCSSTTSCTSVVVSDLTYLYDDFIASNSFYGKWNSRPVIEFFEFENANNPQAMLVDWASVKSRVPGNPILVFRNHGNFVFPDPPRPNASGGAFNWANPKAMSDPAWSSSDWCQSYIDTFYSDATSKYPNEYAVGSGFAGFDDRQASWSGDRVIPRHCGRTWMNTFGEIKKYYSSSAKQLDALQPVTWNDYEEGTEIETGIDNCYSWANQFMSSTLPNTVKWTPDFTTDGSEKTVYAYKVYVMRASDTGLSNPPMKSVGATLWNGATPPAHQYDLSCAVPKGHAYKVFIKAVGQASIQSHMSATMPSSGITWSP